MFPKSALICQVTDLAKLAGLTEDRLEDHAFEPCTASEPLSMGFSPVQDVFAYKYMGYTLLNFTIEKKSVPASAIKKSVKEQCDRLEEANGHRPGKKLMKEIKLAVIDKLLARALPTTKTHNVIIDDKLGYVIFDTTSNGVTSAVMRYLYQVAEIEFVGLKFPGREQMANWLRDDYESSNNFLPAELTADDTVVFEHPGETGKTVKYERSNLSDEDVLANLEAGAEVLSLALTYNDKISFVLKDMMLGRIRPLGVLAEKPKKDVDAFQNAFYLAAAEMSALTTYLTEVA